MRKRPRAACNLITFTKDMDLLSKRALLLGVLVVVLALGFGRIVHGSASKKPSHHAVSCSTHSKNKHANTQHKGKAKSSHSSCKSGSVKGHHSKGQKHATKPVAAPSALQVYAQALKPALNRSVQAFNSITSTMSSQGMDSLAQSCATLGTQTQILEAQVDGIPHPGTWNSPVTNLHFHLMDIFHQMLGATVACQTSAGNQDSGGLASAQSDASTAASALQSQLAYVNSVGR